MKEKERQDKLEALATSVMAKLSEQGDVALKRVDSKRGWLYFEVVTPIPEHLKT